MAKISENYEVVYIIDPAQGEEAIAATVEKFKALTEQHGCTAVEVEEWGKRRLSGRWAKSNDARGRCQETFVIGGYHHGYGT